MTELATLRALLSVAFGDDAGLYPLADWLMEHGEEEIGRAIVEMPPNAFVQIRISSAHHRIFCCWWSKRRGVRCDGKRTWSEEAGK